MCTSVQIPNPEEQGLPAPNLAIGKVTTRKKQNKNDYDAVSSSTAGLSWNIKKWQKGFHFKQQESFYPESEQSQELPVLVTKPVQQCRDI